MPDTKVHSAERGIIAILRGIHPEQVLEVAEALMTAGVRAIEVPLNSPQPFASIGMLAAKCGSDCLVGAGTVLNVEQVTRTHESGGRLVVAPNCNPAVIESAIRLGMQVMPGIATASEAFTALDAGARQLKLFPAASYGANHLKALRTVLPAGVEIYPVGGIGAADIPAWLVAGAAGFGFGTELFTPGYTLAQVRARALAVVAAYRAALAQIDTPFQGPPP